MLYTERTNGIYIVQPLDPHELVHLDSPSPIHDLLEALAVPQELRSGTDTDTHHDDVGLERGALAAARRNDDGTCERRVRVRRDDLLDLRLHVELDAVPLVELVAGNAIRKSVHISK